VSSDDGYDVLMELRVGAPEPEPALAELDQEVKMEAVRRRSQSA
jgi:hypothetical protein